jgi:hypothetical protein
MRMRRFAFAKPHLSTVLFFSIYRAFLLQKTPKHDQPSMPDAHVARHDTVPCFGFSFSVLVLVVQYPATVYGALQMRYLNLE